MELWCSDTLPHVCFHASGQAKGIWELAGIEWRDDMRVYLPVRIVCACARVRVHVHASVALHGCDSMCVCARARSLSCVHFVCATYTRTRARWVHESTRAIKLLRCLHQGGWSLVHTPHAPTAPAHHEHTPHLHYAFTHAIPPYTCTIFSPPKPPAEPVHIHSHTLIHSAQL